MKNLYLICGGGHCRSCIDVIESTGTFIIQGIFDRAKKVGEHVLGYPIIGGDNDISAFVKVDNYFLITLGQIKSAEARILIYENLKKMDANVATVISPRAYVSKHAKIGKGTVVMHDAFINANAVVGENCIINTKALIEHDANVGNHCHISTGAIVNGGCVVEELCFIGSNTVLKQYTTVPKASVLQAGRLFLGE